jgi:hypothetical protein
VLTQSDIDSMWARAHRSFHSGVAAVSAPKAKPASTAGPAPDDDDDTPLALSSRRARAAKSASNIDTRSLRSSGKAKASGSRSKYVVSDDDDESAVEIISAPKTVQVAPSLGESAVCIPVDPRKEAHRVATGRPRLHEGKSSKKATQATFPSDDAVTAEVLEMLPVPRQLVCPFFCSLIYFYL